jgi:hypothetical protein
MMVGERIKKEESVDGVDHRNSYGNSEVQAKERGWNLIGDCCVKIRGSSVG